MNKIRTISAILIEADEATHPYFLNESWGEILKNKKRYPLVELEFALEHLRDLAKEMAQRDTARLRLIFST
jgi:hypothetical protein